MSDPAIRVAALQKTFRVPVREAGLRAATRSLFRREHREVRAVDEVSFTIEPGEVVGFLGPNGAGKTTTLKMLRRSTRSTCSGRSTASSRPRSGQLATSSSSCSTCASS